MSYVVRYYETENVTLDFKLDGTILVIVSFIYCVGGKTLSDQKGLSGSDTPPPVPSRANDITGKLLWDSQVLLKYYLLLKTCFLITTP